MQHHKIGGNSSTGAPSAPTTHKRVTGGNDDDQNRLVPAATLAQVRALLTPYCAEGSPVVVPPGEGENPLSPVDTLRACMDLLRPWL